eukprot:scaffold266133_cov31-Tisochrysis_lutea.AAC.4
MVGQGVPRPHRAARAAKLRKRAWLRFPRGCGRCRPWRTFLMVVQTALTEVLSVSARSAAAFSDHARSSGSFDIADADRLLARGPRGVGVSQQAESAGTEAAAPCSSQGCQPGSRPRARRSEWRRERGRVCAQRVAAGTTG